LRVLSFMCAIPSRAISLWTEGMKENSIFGLLFLRWCWEVPVVAFVAVVARKLEVAFGVLAGEDFLAPREGEKPLRPPGVACAPAGLPTSSIEKMESSSSRVRAAGEEEVGAELRASSSLECESACSWTRAPLDLLWRRGFERLRWPLFPCCGSDFGFAACMDGDSFLFSVVEDRVAEWWCWCWSSTKLPCEELQEPKVSSLWEGEEELKAGIESKSISPSSSAQEEDTLTNDPVIKEPPLGVEEEGEGRMAIGLDGVVPDLRLEKVDLKLESEATEEEK